MLSFLSPKKPYISQQESPDTIIKIPMTLNPLDQHHHVPIWVGLQTGGLCFYILSTLLCPEVDFEDELSVCQQIQKIYLQNLPLKPTIIPMKFLPCLQWSGSIVESRITLSYCGWPSIWVLKPKMY